MQRGGDPAVDEGEEDGGNGVPLVSSAGLDDGMVCPVVPEVNMGYLGREVAL